MRYLMSSISEMSDKTKECTDQDDWNFSLSRTKDGFRLCIYTDHPENIKSLKNFITRLGDYHDTFTGTPYPAIYKVMRVYNMTDPSMTLTVSADVLELHIVNGCLDSVYYHNTRGTMKVSFEIQGDTDIHYYTKLSNQEISKYMSK